MTGTTAPKSSISPALTKTWTFFGGEWHEGNHPILGVRSHGAWLGSVVFDGARAFEGVTPDLDRHLARINRSAMNMLLHPVVSVEEWQRLVAEGLQKFPENAELYIRPMYWAEGGVGGGVRFEPSSTNWCLSLYEAPLPVPRGNATTLSPFRRPTQETATTDSKAGGLYANSARALIEAHQRGFDNCIVLDALGNVAEFANANAFMAKDGVVYTPFPNGTFLNGVTRQRVIGLLRSAGIEVVEATLTYKDFANADEIFSCGNYNKVAPIIRIDARDLQPGPMYQKARELYWDFARSTKR